MKLFATAVEQITARIDAGDALVLIGVGLIVYGAALIHPAGFPLTAGAACVWLGPKV